MSHRAKHTCVWLALEVHNVSATSFFKKKKKKYITPVSSVMSHVSNTIEVVNIAYFTCPTNYARHVVLKRISLSI